MQDSHVPVSHRSARHFELSVSGFLVTHAVFPARSSIESHVHERDIVAIMLGGSFEVAFTRHRLHCGDMSVHTEPAGERHRNSVGTGGAEVLVIQPDPARAELLRPFRGLLESVSQRDHGGVRLQAAQLLHELAQPDDCSPLAAEALILDMFVRLARTEPRSRVQGSAPPQWLARARELVHSADDRRLTTTEIAAEVGVHPAYLVRLFKAHYHLPLGTYARRVRLAAAARRLASTSLPAAQIAIEAGFADQSHFTRRFKQHYGETPARFRRRRGSRS